MTTAPSAAAGRACIVAAAVLWSLSGLFTKVLRESTPLGLHEPRLEPLQIAALRVLFAGLVMVPFLRRRDLTFRPLMGLTAVTFAVMNALFVSAMALGSAANAILLQYTAPLWLTVASVWLLGERIDRRGLVAVALGLAGVAVIVAGSGGEEGQFLVVLMALGAGVTYAGVVLGLRLLRDLSPVWLTAVNHLFGGLVLLPVVLSLPPPSAAQLAWLVLFGGLQMGLPYLLMARGLRSVGPQEAGTLTLLEPVLNPLWAYLASPATETPTAHTLTGGAFILGALAYRYWPARAR